MDTHRIAKELNWEVGVDYPTWGNNDLYLTTIKGGYLQSNETPRQAYERIAKTTCKYLTLHSSIENEIFDILWKGWLIPSTPVMSSFGTSKGLPISCFSGIVGDDMYEIGRKELEMRMLSKHGGGTAYDFSKIRPIGAPIKNGELGTSDGIIPFMKSFDSTIMSAKQGALRRGAVAMYLNANHQEYPEFLEIREPKGDINRQCHNIHQGAIFSDDFMEKVPEGGREYDIWINTLKKRIKTGEPYCMFIDNANRNLPQNWKDNNLTVKHSNLCNEIYLPTSEDHTLVCCLSSLNLYKYDEWKDTNTVKLAIYLLDAVISEFLDKAQHIKGIEDSVRFAVKSRALGLGALGWSSYLQSKMIPFASLEAIMETHKIFKNIRNSAEEATLELGSIYGEPLWCKGTGRRNLTLLAIAPNRSSSKLAGGLSQGVEPFAANLYVDDDAKGLHIRRNPELVKLLQSKNRDITEVWEQIELDKGSVMNVRCLSDFEKEVFKTFKEINQLELVRQACIRQKYIDQGQSINIAFFKDAPAKFINKVHYEAWKGGLKGLYYLRSESNLRADTATQRDLYKECIVCEG